MGLVGLRNVQRKRLRQTDVAAINSPFSSASVPLSQQSLTFLAKGFLALARPPYCSPRKPAGDLCRFFALLSPLHFIFHDSPSAQLCAALRVLHFVSPFGVRSGRLVVFLQSLRGGSSPLKSTKPKEGATTMERRQNHQQTFPSGQRYSSKP
jgi:hypothetical protein